MLGAGPRAFLTMTPSTAESLYSGVALQGRKLRPRGLDLTGRARIGSAPGQFGATASSLQLEKRFSLLTWNCFL